MICYRHTVQYYETDKMGVTHHSNYIRWMEEARVALLEQMEADDADTCTVLAGEDFSDEALEALVERIVEEKLAERGL